MNKIIKIYNATTTEGVKKIIVKRRNYYSGREAA